MLVLSPCQGVFRLKFRLLFSLFTIMAASQVSSAQTATTERLSYPETRRVEQVDDYHGTKVSDPYRWLEDANSPETAAWVEAENKVTFAHLRSLPGREQLKKRLTQLWNYPRFSAPFKEAGNYFFYKNDGLQNQSILYVQPSLKAPPRVLLNPNKLSKDGTVALSTLDVSDDGKLMGYGLSRAGSDWSELHVRNVATGRDRADLLKWVKFSGLSWTKDNKGFFYSRYPQPDEKTALQTANRKHQIFYHVVGTKQDVDTLIYERPDEPEWLMGAGVTEDGRYAIVSLSKTGPKNRLYYIDLKNGKKPDVGAPVVKLIDEFEASYDFIGNDGTTWYFQTDSNSPRGRVIAIDITRPERPNWKTLIPESRDTLRGVSLVGNQFICTYLHNAYSAVKFYDLKGKFQKELKLPGLGTVGGLGGKRTDKELFYVFTSYLYPPTIYRYDVKTGKSALFRKPQIDFDPSPYVTRQVWFKSKDGTRVPMFVTHRKGLKKNGNNPTYLYGYGGFNVSLTPGFSVSNLAWLEQGGIVAVANLRGGGEFGEEWHRAGTKEKKQNVFDDFIGAAQFLIREKYTSPKKLAIAGGSNGGLLVGAVVNQRPDLFAVALPAVGVMDMLRFHKFTIGSAWVYDYGSSDDPKEFQSLIKYSPLHTIKPGVKYPATMVTTADHDDRVVPGHSFKYAATLQAAQAGDAPVIIRIETKAGHGAGKPMSKIIEEEADKWAFVMHHTSLKLEAEK